MKLATPCGRGYGDMCTIMEKARCLAVIFKTVYQNGVRHNALVPLAVHATCLSFSGMHLQASCVKKTQGSPGAVLSQKQIDMARSTRPQPPPSHPASVSLGLSLPREHAIAEGQQDWKGGLQPPCTILQEGFFQ